jgi:hypothetical protein
MGRYGNLVRKGLRGCEELQIEDVGCGCTIQVALDYGLLTNSLQDCVRSKFMEQVANSIVPLISSCVGVDEAVLAKVA